jgi:hypothetical protein
VSAYLIKYEGPTSFAVQAATMLAEADGVELRGSEPPQRRSDPPDTVVLALTVEGDADAVLDAVADMRVRLPPDASLEIAGGA